MWDSFTNPSSWSLFDNPLLPTGTYKEAFAELSGANQAADASQKMAEARELQVRRAENISKPTANELEQVSYALSNQARQVAFNQTQLDSLGSLLAQISPVLAQGFQQQMAIMSGDDRGAFANPLSKQIDIERQRNLNRQVASMGAGASSSSAGMMADALFGQQAGMARLQAAGQVGAMNAQNAGIYGGLMGQGLQIGASNQDISNSIMNALGGFQTRQANAALGVAGVAGSNNVGDLYKGQATQQMVNTITGSIAGALAQKVAG